MRRGTKGNKYWTFERLKEETLKYKTKGEFKKKNNPAYQAARTSGFYEILCEHMEIKLSWTKDLIQQEALKYNRKVDFMNFSNTAYQKAHKFGIISEVCSHMPIRECKGKKPHNYKWTYEKLEEAAKQYDTKYDFFRYDKKAYNVAVKSHILDNICLHMPNISGSSCLEKELLLEIKKEFGDAKKRRKSKIYLKNYPQIKYFELDIFVPSVNKGIEFDGTYWHSYDGLRRSRKHWKKEDVLNYHEIKDEGFRSIGIEIIHINEKDWIENKKACIKKCLDFLNKANI